MKETNNKVSALLETQEGRYGLRHIYALMDEESQNSLRHVNRELYHFFSNQPRNLYPLNDSYDELFKESMGRETNIYVSDNVLLMEEMAQEVNNCEFRERYGEPEVFAIMRAFMRGLISQENFATIMEHIVLLDCLNGADFSIMKLDEENNKNSFRNSLKNIAKIGGLRFDEKTVDSFFELIEAEKDKAGLFIYVIDHYLLRKLMLLEDYEYLGVFLNFEDDMASTLKEGGEDLGDFLKRQENLVINAKNELMFMSPKLRRLFQKNNWENSNGHYPVRYVPTLGDVTINDIENYVLYKQARQASFSLKGYSEAMEIHFLSVENMVFNEDHALCENFSNTLNLRLESKLDSLYLTHAFFILKDEKDAMVFLSKVKGKNFVDLDKFSAFKEIRSMGYKTISNKAYSAFFRNSLEKGSKNNGISFLKVEIEKNPRQFDVDLTFSPENIHDQNITRSNKADIFLHDVFHNYADAWRSPLLPMIKQLVSVMRWSSGLKWSQLIWSLIDIELCPEIMNKTDVTNYFLGVMVDLENRHSLAFYNDDSVKKGALRFFDYFLLILWLDMKKSPEVWCQSGLDVEKILGSKGRSYRNFCIINNLMEFDILNKLYDLADLDSRNLLFKLSVGSSKIELDRIKKIKEGRQGDASYNLFYIEDVDDCFFDKQSFKGIVEDFLATLEAESSETVTMRQT